MDIVDRLQNKKRNTTDEEDDALTEIQTLRAKVEVLVEALRIVMNEAEEIVLHDTNFVAVPFEIFCKMEDEYEALATYDKLSEVNHDTK